VQVDTVETFVEKHKPKLFGYLLRMTGDYEHASDIMQESFTRYLEHYADQAPSAALLYTIARNVLFDRSRSRIRLVELDEHADQGGFHPEHELLVKEEYRAFLKAFQRLSEDERNILSLAVSTQMSYREIGEVVAMSESNVKVKIHRARQKLREILKGGVQ